MPTPNEILQCLIGSHFTAIDLSQKLRLKK